MENASKALIMAGGMLLAILLVTVLIYAWGLFSEYQASRDALSEIEDTAKFNLQFANYDRDNVQGYEILSILNKVVDYNERKSAEQSVYGNDEKYPWIKIGINMVNEDYRKKLSYTDENQLFQSNYYAEDKLTAINGNIRTSFKNNIEEKIRSTQVDLGNVNEDTLTSMAKNIRAIFKTPQEIESEKELDKDKNVENIYKVMVNKFNSYVESDYKIEYDQYVNLILDDSRKTNKKITTRSGHQIENLYTKLCAYYEYMQFKKAIFKCSKLNYDEGASGRVTEIEFEFTGKIK